VICNIGGLGLLILLVNLLVPKQHRVSTVGWVCAAYSLAVFASPLSVMVMIHLSAFLQTSAVFCSELEINIQCVMLQRKVIKTKSVEYMPFLLSLSLTLNAVMWFFYGLLIKDKFIAVILIDIFTFIFQYSN